MLPISCDRTAMWPGQMPKAARRRSRRTSMRGSLPRRRNSSLRRALSWIHLWRWDAYHVGAAGVDRAARCGLGALVEADFDGGEVVVAAGESEARSGDGGIGGGKEVNDLAGRHGDLMVEVGERGGNGHRVEGGAG